MTEKNPGTRGIRHWLPPRWFPRELVDDWKWHINELAGMAEDDKQKEEHK
jgi:hypothetical protein